MIAQKYVDRRIDEVPRIEVGIIAAAILDKVDARGQIGARGAQLFRQAHERPLKILVQLLEVPFGDAGGHAAYGGDDLKLAGALVDGGYPRVAVVPLDGIVPHVARAAEDLNGVRRDADGGLAGVVFRDGRHKGGKPLVAALLLLCVPDLVAFEVAGVEPFLKDDIDVHYP